MRATPGSVWASTDRAAFEDNVRKFHKQTRSNPAVSSDRQPSADTQCRTNTASYNGLPLAVEQKLADHFAFLAAWQNASDAEVAATVATTSHPPSFRVTLASSGVIPKEVMRALGQIAYRLQQRARNGQHTPRCVSPQAQV